MSTAKCTTISLATLPESLIARCPCGNLSNEVLQYRLSQILASLCQQIEGKEKQVLAMRKQFQEAIRQKQEIIERLASANSTITLQNQALSKQLRKTEINHKINVSYIENKCRDKVKQLESIVAYLEQKNNQVKLIPVEAKPEMQYSIQKSQSPTHASSKRRHTKDTLSGRSSAIFQHDLQQSRILNGIKQSRTAGQKFGNDYGDVLNARRANSKPKSSVNGHFTDEISSFF